VLNVDKLNYAGNLAWLAVIDNAARNPKTPLTAAGLLNGRVERGTTFPRSV
jgi:hypothetical protein